MTSSSGTDTNAAMSSTAPIADNARSGVMTECTSGGEAPGVSPTAQGLQRFLLASPSLSSGSRARHLQ
jgi:hypothetical protein